MLDKLFRRRPVAVEPPLRSACFAPHSALYLQPNGLVKACCVSGLELGWVTGDARQSLQEIWNGAVLAAQRRELEAGSFDLGCQECGINESVGGRKATYANHFDRFAQRAPHRYPKLLDLAMSSRCNLQCVMCNGELSSAIRMQREGLPPLPDAYDGRFFEELEEFLPHVERFQFKGGEPFLARENRRIWDFLIERGLTPEVSVTTNGTIYNENVEHYVRELRMHPNISIDGMDPDTLESIRVGVDANALWRNIDRFQALADEAGNGMTLSFCLMQSNWRDIAPFLREVDRRGLNCNVIFVNQPHRFDLLRLTRDELSTVRRELARSEPDLVTPEPQRIWREILTRLDAQLEHPVEIVVRSTLYLDESEQAAVRAELVERHGIDPLMVIADAGGFVESVEVPKWSTWLEPEGFVGQPIDSLATLFQARVGVKTLLSNRLGVALYSVTIESPAGARVLEVNGFHDERTQTSRAFVVEVEPETDGSVA